MLMQLSENISANSEAVIDILNEHGAIEYVDLLATYTDGTPAPVQISIIIDSIETDITSYALSQYKPNVEFKANMSAQLKIVNPNANDVIIRGIVKYNIIHERPRLYLMHGEIPGKGYYTGLYYDTSPPVSASYTDLTVIEDYNETLSIKNGLSISRMYLVKQGWLDFRADADLQITYRVIYPYCIYFSGKASKLFLKFQDYMIYSVYFENKGTNTVNATVQLLNSGHPSITFNNVGSGVSHTIYIPKIDKLIRTKDITPFLLGEVEV